MGNLNNTKMNQSKSLLLLFKKSYDLPLDFLQYRREKSAESILRYSLFGIAGGQKVDSNFS